MDYLDLGSTPCLEDCAQVGSDNYSEHARKECRAYINQLKRIHGEPPAGAAYKIKANPHDFGTYHTVQIMFTNEEGADYAYSVEGNLPEKWDTFAVIELADILFLRSK